LSAIGDPAWGDAARVARSFTAGKGQETTSRTGQQHQSLAQAQKSPGDAGAFELIRLSRYQYLTAGPPQLKR
jgi:hypothetical protein